MSIKKCVFIVCSMSLSAAAIVASALPQSGSSNQPALQAQAASRNAQHLLSPVPQPQAASGNRPPLSPCRSLRDPKFDEMDVRVVFDSQAGSLPLAALIGSVFEEEEVQPHPEWRPLGHETKDGDDAPKKLPSWRRPETAASNRPGTAGECEFGRKWRPDELEAVAASLLRPAGDGQRSSEVAKKNPEEMACATSTPDSEAEETRAGVPPHASPLVKIQSMIYRKRLSPRGSQSSEK